METESEKRAREEEEKGGGLVAVMGAEINTAIFDAEGEVEIEEETVREVMKWLEEEKELDSAPLSFPPSSPSYLQETNFITINDNEESCGPAISSSASTVMASVDTRAGRSGVPYFVGCPSDRAERPSAPSLMWTPAFFPLRVAEDECSTAAEEEVEYVDGLVGAGGFAVKAKERRQL